LCRQKEVVVVVVVEEKEEEEEEEEPADGKRFSSQQTPQTTWNTSKREHLLSN